MLELEVYAAGLGDLDKILELDHQLAAIPGLRYKVDRNHNLVYLELDQPTITFREIRAIFRKLALDSRFIGAIPAELQPKTKTKHLGVSTRQQMLARFFNALRGPLIRFVQYL